MRLVKIGVLLGCSFLMSSLAFAQASISGVVRDTSGAVLPGVTVETSSPVLIEKVRTVATDGSGIYRVIELPPGEYTVTFVLTGFATVKREGIEIAGTQTATVNIDMRVGAVTESVTVSGEAPLVDVQGVTQQHVLSRQVVDDIPAGRTGYALAALIPGMVRTGIGAVHSDVGGNGEVTDDPSVAIHGGRGGDQLIAVDGLDIAAHTGISGYLMNLGNAQEVDVSTVASGGESPYGGVVMNLIPRDGGNTFKGAAFGAFSNKALQTTNFTQELADRGLQATDIFKSNKQSYNLDYGLGGPIAHDKLWFYVSGSRLGAQTLLPVFANGNAENRNAWLYAPDPSGANSVDNSRGYANNVRLTWQATPKNKISGYTDYQVRCFCPEINIGITPEASNDSKYDPEWVTQLAWSAPVTSKLLLEAAFQSHTMTWGDFPPSSSSLGYSHDLSLIQVTDDDLGVTYRGSGNFVDARNHVYRFRAAASEVTGAHQFKAGINYDRSSYPITQDTNTSHLFYNFASGVPQSITEWATPYSSDSYVVETGVFAQDRWTLKHLTLNGAVRFDRVQTYFPAQTVGPSQYTPNRNLSIPNTDLLDWKDVTPRVGAAYDLFGNGKTAVKASIGKYLLREGAPATYGASANPLNTLAASTTRSWTDANGDFIPQCNLLNPDINGECGPIDNNLFGLPVPSLTYDPAFVTGWGKRDYNWLFSASVQHQVMSNMSVNLEYNRRSYGNQPIVVNRAVTAADFTPFSITAPSDPLLPGGGGYTVSNLHDVVPAKFGLTDNFLTSASNYGGLTERWQGVDASTSIRGRNSLLIQGGISTGSTLYDDCAALALHPDISPTGTLKGARTFGGAVPNFHATILPRRHRVAAAVQGARQLCDSESRCPGLHRPPEYSRSTDPRQLQCQERGGSAITQPSALGWREQCLGESGPAGNALRGPPQPGRFPRREGAQIRRPWFACERQPRYLQRAELQRGHGTEQFLRGLADTPASRFSKVCQGQRAARLLRAHLLDHA